MAHEKFAIRLSEEDRTPTEEADPTGPTLGPGHRSGAHPAQDRCRLERVPSGGGPGHVAAHGGSHQAAVRRGGIGRCAPRPSPGQPVIASWMIVGKPHPVSSTGQALIALACSDAPEGHDHWTLRLLADKVVELGVVESLSYETVRLRLKKHPQALAETAVVHLPDERGVRGGHGGCARPLRRALRPQPAGSMLRRDLHSTVV